MIIPLNWLKKYTEIEMPIADLSTLIGARLVEIEEVESIVDKYDGSIVVKVVECYKHQDSEHLNITKIDDNGAINNIERDKNGLIQVVCGAENVRAGMFAVWLIPGSIVPSSKKDSEPFVINKRKLRGEISYGMLASAKELDLFDDHDGILELDDGLAIGKSLALSLELDDYLLDIENKSLTHRPDTFGIIGFAREVSAIMAKRFVSPQWLNNSSLDYGDKQGDQEAPSVSIDDPKLSARYQAVVLSDADSKLQSPLIIQTFLSRVGVRPINAVVDVTNYLMMLTGQPLHAFDYDKVKAVGGSDPSIHVRAGIDKEKLELLDGRVIELSSDDIVIAAGNTAIGLAGAMGGANTEIDKNTKNIILESASFNLYNLRSTQMRHGIFSEAITRFTKGQAPELCAPVLAEAIRLLSEWSGARRVSDVADLYPGKSEPVVVNLRAEHINNILGSSFTKDDIKNSLENAEFIVEINDNEELIVRVPYWRADIKIIEDIAEEVGRINGFDSILPTLPRRDLTAIVPSKIDDIKYKIRNILLRSGANEVFTYSFIHGDVLLKSDQNPTDSYKIINSISPQLQYYRQSLTPSLLSIVHQNVKSGYDQFALFEINKTHSKIAGLVEDGVPPELHRVGLVVVNKVAIKGAPYYQAKSIIDYLGMILGLKLDYKLFDDNTKLAFTKPFDLNRSARIVDRISGQSIGIVGEYKQSVKTKFKLPDYVAGFELLTEAVMLALEQKQNQYVANSRFPSSERDLCFQLGLDTSYSNLIEFVNMALEDSEYDTEIKPIDIYQKAGSVTKNITIRIKITSKNKTLVNEDIVSVINKVIDSVINNTSAKLI